MLRPPCLDSYELLKTPRPHGGFRERTLSFSSLSEFPSLKKTLCQSTPNPRVSSQGEQRKVCFTLSTTSQLSKIQGNNSDYDLKEIHLPSTSSSRKANLHFIVRECMDLLNTELNAILTWRLEPRCLSSSLANALVCPTTSEITLEYVPYPSLSRQRSHSQDLGKSIVSRLSCLAPQAPTSHMALNAMRNHSLQISCTQVPRGPWKGMC